MEAINVTLSLVGKLSAAGLPSVGDADVTAVEGAGERFPGVEHIVDGFGQIVLK
jgi:hypothetical protein